MDEILRNMKAKRWHTPGMWMPGNFIFLNFCVGNVGESVERPVEGALDHKSDRRRMAGLTFADVVKVDVDAKRCVGYSGDGGRLVQPCASRVQSLHLRLHKPPCGPRLAA